MRNYCQKKVCSTGPNFKYTKVKKGMAYIVLHYPVLYHLTIVLAGDTQAGNWANKKVHVVNMHFYKEANNA